MGAIILVDGPDFSANYALHADTERIFEFETW